MTESATATIGREMMSLWAPIRELLGDQQVYDAHTHIGQNDPDGYTHTLEELLAALAPLDARAVTFAMHEPDGYPPANDAVLQAVAQAPDKLVAFVRVDPRNGAVAEATRCLDAGARGIKLHPRAERFTLSEPAVDGLFALAHERRVPILIHAGRGIPALGENSIELARRYPGAYVILAHAAVSDLSWMWRELPGVPNVLIDTSWWSPGDMMALFALVPSGQILWASDAPYGPPLVSAVSHLRFAIQAGVEEEALRSIAGGQVERLLAGEELAVFPRPEGEARPVSYELQRIVYHLVAALGAVITRSDPAEAVSLAKVACDVGDQSPNRELILKVEALLDMASEMALAEQLDQQRIPASAVLLMTAMTLARTPAAPGL